MEKSFDVPEQMKGYRKKYSGVESELSGMNSGMEMMN